MRSIEQVALAFLTERRLTDIEAVAILKIAKDDSRLAYIKGRWGNSVESLMPDMRALMLKVVSTRVLAWMDKYHEKHSARALFTGES